MTLFFPVIVVYCITLFVFVIVTVSGIAILKIKEWGRKLVFIIIAIEIIWICGDIIFMKSFGISNPYQASGADDNAFAG